MNSLIAYAYIEAVFTVHPAGVYGIHFVRFTQFFTFPVWPARNYNTIIDSIAYINIVAVLVVDFDGLVDSLAVREVELHVVHVLHRRTLGRLLNGQHMGLEWSIEELHFNKYR